MFKILVLTRTKSYNLKVYNNEKAPKRCFRALLYKTATTYSPTCTQYHRRDEA